MFKTKKYRYIVIAVILLLMTTVAYALSGVIEIQNSPQKKLSATYERKLRDIESTKKGNRIGNYTGKVLLDRKTLTEDEFIDLISYMDFLTLYTPSEAEIQGVDRIIQKGICAQEAFEMYRFWKTTNEGIGLLDEMAAHKGDIVSSRWIAASYEVVRKSRGDWEDIDYGKYDALGLTSEDYEAARVLERKGKLRIHQILDKAAEKNGWKSIVDESTGNTNSKKVKVSKSEDLNISPVRLLQMQELADIYQVEFSASEYDAYLDEVKKIEQQRSNEMVEALHEMGFRIDPNSLDEKEKAARDQILSKAEGNGLSKDDIQRLVDEGFTNVDVLNISEIVKVKKLDVKAAAEKYAREEM